MRQILNFVSRYRTEILVPVINLIVCLVAGLVGSCLMDDASYIGGWAFVLGMTAYAVECVLMWHKPGSSLQSGILGVIVGALLVYYIYGGV